MLVQMHHIGYLRLYMNLMMCSFLGTNLIVNILQEGYQWTSSSLFLLTICKYTVKQYGTDVVLERWKLCTQQTSYAHILILVVSFGAFNRSGSSSIMYK